MPTHFVVGCFFLAESVVKSWWAWEDCAGSGEAHLLPMEKPQAWLAQVFLSTLASGHAEDPGSRNQEGK